MNRQQLLEIRKFMFKHKNFVSTATELAEDTAAALELEDELDDEVSPIWNLALQYFNSKE